MSTLRSPLKTQFRELLFEGLELRQMMTVDLGFGADSQDAIFSNSVFGNVVQQSLYGVPAPMAVRVISQSIRPHVADVMSAGPTGSATINDATGSGTAIIGPFQSQMPVGYASATPSAIVRRSG